MIRSFSLAVGQVDRETAGALSPRARNSLFGGPYQGIIRELLFFLMPLPAGFL